MVTLGHMVTLETIQIVTPEPPGVTGGALYWAMCDICSHSKCMGSYGDTGGKPYDDPQSYLVSLGVPYISLWVIFGVGHMATLGHTATLEAIFSAVIWRHWRYLFSAVI